MLCSVLGAIRSIYLPSRPLTLTPSCLVFLLLVLLPTESDYLEDSGCLALNYADLLARSDRSSLRDEGAPSWILLQLWAAF